MQKLIGLVRRCVQDYHMIEEGDRIGVGVSGGKDSVALLAFLAELRKYITIKSLKLRLLPLIWAWVWTTVPFSSFAIGWM